MDGDEIDLFDQFGVFEPDVPGFGEADRCPNGFAYLAEVFDHSRHRLLGAQQHLVADESTDHGAMIFAIETYEILDLFEILFVLIVDPGAQGHIQIVHAGQTRYLRQGSLDGIGTHCVRVTGQQGQIFVDFCDRR